MTLLLLLFLILDAVNNSFTLKRIKPFLLIGISALTLAILFKLLHWMGGNILILFSHSYFALVYIIQFYLRRRKTLLETIKTIAVITFLAASLTSVLHWKFAFEFLISALTGFGVYFILLTIQFFSHKKQMPTSARGNENNL